MAEDKPRLARLTAIITQLQSKRLVTARDIANKHAVSIRTVYRDIRTLEQSGIPIVTEEGKGYTLLEGYNLPPVLFTEEEANALVTAEQIIANNPDESLVQSFNAALEKIKAVLKNSQKQKVELLSERMQIRKYYDSEPASHYLIQLQKAITEYQLVELNYLSANAESSTRWVEPFALIHTQENWLLIAFCRLRIEFRTFRLDRIEQLRLSNQHFDPHNLSLSEYFEERKKFWTTTTPDIPLTPSQSTFAMNQKKKVMQRVTIKAFKIIGIATRTTNENMQSAQDISQLWGRFMAEGIADKIPHRVDECVLSLYTNYEGDHTQPYDTILGCRVSSLDNIPDGMVGEAYDERTYAQFDCKGDLTKGLLYQAWTDIHQQDLDRAYIADFEVYGAKAQNPTDAELKIYVGLK